MPQKYAVKNIVCADWTLHPKTQVPPPQPATKGVAESKGEPETKGGEEPAEAASKPAPPKEAEQPPR